MRFTGRVTLLAENVPVFRAVWCICGQQAAKIDECIRRSKPATLDNTLPNNLRNPLHDPNDEEAQVAAFEALRDESKPLLAT